MQVLASPGQGCRVPGPTRQTVPVQDPGGTIPDQASVPGIPQAGNETYCPILDTVDQEGWETKILPGNKACRLKGGKPLQVTQRLHARGGSESVNSPRMAP